MNELQNHNDNERNERKDLEKVSSSNVHINTIRHSHTPNLLDEVGKESLQDD